MYEPKITVALGAPIFGEIRFPSPARLEARPAWDALVWQIPMSVQLRKHEDVPGLPFLSGIHATLGFEGREIGQAWNDGTYNGYGGDVPSQLIARIPLTVLRRVENARSGRPPKFRISLVGDLSVLLENGGRRVQTELCKVHGDVDVEYDRDAWVSMLRAAGVAENVVVEIPLPPSPPPPWNDVWSEVRAARDQLNQAGETGWQGAIVAVRHALECWQKIEKEDHGLGWTPPKPLDRQQRTRAQRMDNLRWHLLQCAHEAAHTPADRWTREDAQLLLGALAGLLAVRNP